MGNSENENGHFEWATSGTHLHIFLVVRYIAYAENSVKSDFSFHLLLNIRTQKGSARVFLIHKMSTFLQSKLILIDGILVCPDVLAIVFVYQSRKQRYFVFDLNI